MKKLKNISFKEMLNKLASISIVIYKSFVKPWPAFTFLLLFIGLISGIIPYLQVIAITTMVDNLKFDLLNGVTFSFDVIKSHYFLWIVLFSITLFADLLIKSRNFLTYLGTILEVRIRKTLYRDFLIKSSTLKLHYFESSSYFDKVNHIREMFKQNMTIPLLHLQRFVAYGMTMVVVFYQLGTVNLLIPLLLFISAICITRLHTKLGIDFWEMNYGQSRLLRSLYYWRNLLVDRDAAVEVKTFELEDNFKSRWYSLSTKRLKQIKQLSKKHIIKQMLLAVLQTSFLAIAFILLVSAAVDGEISIGYLLALLLLVIQLESEIDPLGQRIQAFSKLVLQMRTLLEFLDLKGVEEIKGCDVPDLKKEIIKFDNVSFTYPESKTPVIKDISFSIKPGEKIAIVGENGAGKSTLVKLFLGLYQPTSGQITVGGIPLENINLVKWREAVSANFQDFMKYSFTVRENIGFGNYQLLHNQHKIEGAAAKSGALEYIHSLSSQYDTKLGREFKNGQDLSGGQWQKLALARTYFRDASVLVLDEPTAALDPISELEVYKTFLNITKAKTALLISHRLGTARYSDKILFMKEGKVTEYDTHKNLIKQNGEYASLYNLQAQWYQESNKSVDGGSEN